MEPFEQHRPAVRVGPQQQDGAVAVPVLEREVLELRLVRVDLRVQLQHGRLPVAGQHGHHERAVAVHQRAVDGQLPLVEEVPGHRREPVDPRGPVVAAGAHLQHAGGQLHRHGRTVPPPSTGSPSTPVIRKYDAARPPTTARGLGSDSGSRGTPHILPGSSVANRMRVELNGVSPASLADGVPG